MLFLCRSQGENGPPKCTAYGRISTDREQCKARMAMGAIKDSKTDHMKKYYEDELCKSRALVIEKAAFTCVCILRIV